MLITNQFSDKEYRISIEISKISAIAHLVSRILELR